MSTKIYEGIRFPVGRLDGFMEAVGPQHLRRVVQRVRTIQKSLKSEAVEHHAKKNYPELIKDPKFKKRALRESEFEILSEQCMKASQSMVRDEYSMIFWLDCGWTLWPRGLYFYAYPYGESWTRERIQFPKWVEEYGYWNNTDKPGNLSDRQWDARRRNWDRALGAHGRDHVRYSVVDFTTRSNAIVSMGMIERAIYPYPEDRKAKAT